jgi:hypothetical protein
MPEVITIPKLSDREVAEALKRVQSALVAVEDRQFTFTYKIPYAQDSTVAKRDTAVNPEDESAIRENAHIIDTFHFRGEGSEVFTVTPFNPLQGRK